ncbi:MAG: hypothetical protein ACYS1C_09480, partial [Planctomycetota bacterium]
DGPERVLTRARPEQMATWAAAGGGRYWSLGADAPGGGPPGRRDALIPPALRSAAAIAADVGVRLHPWLYLLAAALLVAGELLRLPGRRPQPSSAR